MSSTLCFIKAATLLWLVVSVTKVASSVVGDGALSHLARIATLDDVAHTFTSNYKSGKGCPSKIEVSAKPKKLSDAGIAEVNLADIKEDGQKCRGLNTPSIKFVTQKKAKSGNFLAEMGYRKVQLALNKTIAASFMKNDDMCSLDSVMAGVFAASSTRRRRHSGSLATWGSGTDYVV